MKFFLPLKQNKLFRIIFPIAIITFGSSLIYPCINMNTAIQQKNQSDKIKDIKQNCNTTIQYFSQTPINSDFYTNFYLRYINILFPKSIFDYSTFNNSVNIYDSWSNDIKKEFNLNKQKLNYNYVSENINDENIVNQLNVFVNNFSNLDFSTKANKGILFGCLMILQLSFLCLILILYCIVGYRLGGWTYVLIGAMYIFTTPLIILFLY